MHRERILAVQSGHLSGRLCRRIGTNWQLLVVVGLLLPMTMLLLMMRLHKKPANRWRTVPFVSRQTPATNPDQTSKTKQCPALKFDQLQRATPLHFTPHFGSNNINKNTNIKIPNPKSQFTQSRVTKAACSRAEFSEINEKIGFLVGLVLFGFGHA